MITELQKSTNFI